MFGVETLESKTYTSQVIRYFSCYYLKRRTFLCQNIQIQKTTTLG